MLIASNRVALRRLSPADQKTFLAYRADLQIAQFQSWDPMSNDEATGFLNRMATISPLLRPGKWVQIAVADVQSDALMGDMGLFLCEDGQESELGITLAKEFHGRGLASEAMRRAMDFVFAQTKVTHIICGADSRNTASLSMIRKLGFEWTHREPIEGTEYGDEMFRIPRPYVRSE